MDEQAIQSIKDVLDNNEQIAIAVGKNPTLDEMGAALALYLALDAENKRVTIASPTQPIVELSNLVGINRVKQNFESGSGDLVVSFPYKEGEIEKVSYTLENGYLNIIVKAGVDGLSFSENEVQYKRNGGSISVLFVVGTPRLSSLGNLFDPQNLKDTTIVNIDNKSENQGFGEVVFISPDFSSVSEMIAELLSKLGCEIDNDIAQNLMLGISFATDNFQRPNTSSLAFEMAGILLKKGATRTPKTQVKMPLLKTQDPFLGQGYQDKLDEPSFDEEDFLDTFDEPIKPPVPSQRFQQPKPFQRMSGQTSAQPKIQSFQKHFQKQNIKQEQKKNEQTPSDWLTPKIYKGSSNV